MGILSPAFLSERVGDCLLRHAFRFPSLNCEFHPVVSQGCGALWDKVCLMTLTNVWRFRGWPYHMDCLLNISFQSVTNRDAILISVLCFLISKVIDNRENCWPWVQNHLQRAYLHTQAWGPCSLRITAHPTSLFLDYCSLKHSLTHKNW